MSARAVDLAELELHEVEAQLAAHGHPASELVRSSAGSGNAE